MRALAPALLAALALAAGGGARAEMYRCPGAGGSPVYTSDPAACPGALRHEPSREVQRLPGAPAPAVEPPAPGGRPAPPAAAADEPADAQAAMWRRRRSEAEAELRALTAGHEDLREIVTWCNRGGELVVEDDVGIRDRYDCGDAREAFGRASTRIAELRAYLAGGLDDECRRAGCLPGWVR